MFTAKAIVYFSTAATLLSLALVLNDFQIGILVLALACLFFFSNLWGLPSRVTVGVQRRIIPSETFVGENVRIESEVVNNTDSSLVNVLITEDLDKRIVPERGSNQLLVSMRPGERSSLVMEFPAPPRGVYNVGPLTVRVGDPMGFYLTEVRFPVETIRVIPRPERLIEVQLRPQHIRPWPGMVPSKALGIGTEFYSMRDYVQGDDPKRINWKASARFGSLVINETEAEKVTDVMVVLDTDVNVFGTKENEVFEREVVAAASIASLLLRQGNRVGIVLQGEERGSVPAGFGKRHERRILSLLAAARPGKSSLPTSYVMNLMARRMIPSRSQVIVISPLLDSEAIEGAKQLALAGYSMLVLSPSTFFVEKPVDLADSLAVRLVMLERSIALLGLEKSATTIDWPKEIPLSAVLREVGRRRHRYVA